MPKINAVNRRYSWTRPSFKPLTWEEKYIEYLRSIRGPLSYLNTIDIPCNTCEMTLVQSAKQCCCQPCYLNWLFLEDGKKCESCKKPLKDLLTKEQVDKFCERTGLKWKRLTIAGHSFINYFIEQRIQKMAQKTSN